MKDLFFLIPFITINFLQANSNSLDTHMSNSEKSASGVHKLTPQEKAVLQKWINTHHTINSPVRTSTSSSEPSSTSLSPNPPPITLSQNIAGGRYIELTDNSIWEINPSDTSISSAWITPVEISIGRNPDSNWPYVLINSATGSKIRARRIQELPKQGGSSDQVAPINDSRLGPP